MEGITMPVDPARLRMMVEAGDSLEQIATAFGCSKSWIVKQKMKHQLTTPQLDHSRYIPRDVLRAHQNSHEYQYLHFLSYTAQTKRLPAPLNQVESALVWATRAKDESKERAYDQDHGFSLVDYDPESEYWAIGELVDLAGPVIREISMNLMKDDARSAAAAAKRALGYAQEQRRTS